MNEVKTRAQHWQRVKTILADALERTSPENRTAYLESSCGGDTTLMREVEALLAQSTRSLDRLADETPVAFMRQAPAQLSGRRVGAYEVVREIGRGGMGAVYLAKRADGQFDKEVAIKLLKRGTDTDEILRRFRAERQILARLDHPNIARLLDAGTTEDGLPYFVMEYVEGVPITEYARRQQLSIAERLALFLKVCSAVEAAHEKQIIHRDLKPSNVIVRPDSEPKLLDFGIAKLLAAPDDAMLVTITEQRRLTPACASPEQTRGEIVTPASDVYALGALFYELLTGVSPHRFSSAQPSPEEIACVICETEPLRPSAITLSVENRRRIRGDLDLIALAALRKEPERRYGSVAHLADDLRRHIAGRAINARKGSRSYRIGRFLRRHKLRIVAAVLFIAIGATTALLVFRFSSDAQKRAAVLPTKDLVAYDLYLRSNDLMAQIATSTDWEGDTRRAIDLLERAVTHDPSFGIAFAQLSDCHLNLYSWVDHTAERLRQAELAVEQAARLAPESPPSLLAQADFVANQRRWNESLQLLRRAQHLQPNNATLFDRTAQAEERLGLTSEALRDMERARELAPDNPNIPNHLMRMYTGARKYRKADEVAEASIGHFPNGPQYYRARSVYNSLHRENFAEAQARLAQLPAKFDASGFKTFLALSIPYAKQDLKEFGRIAATMSRDNFIAEIEADVAFMEVVVAEKEGNRAKMESVLNTFLPKAEAELQKSGPDKAPGSSPSQLAIVARVHCLLGRIDDAMRESEEAMHLIPTSADAVTGPANEVIRAEVLMRAGQTNDAIGMLARLAKIPYGPSYGELRTLRWNRLRGDRRFDAIVQQLAETVNDL